jgi:PAS domain S-box-containing protein
MYLQTNGRLAACCDKTAAVLKFASDSYQLFGMSDKSATTKVSKTLPMQTEINPLSRSEESLLDAKPPLQSILIANEVATWTWDVVNNQLIGDENLARLFGVAANAGPIESYMKVIHPDDRDQVRAAFEAVLEGPNDRYALEYRVVRESGEVSWLSARGKVERGPDGKVIYFPGVVIDITERKASERKTEELRFQLDRQAHLFDITLSSIKDFAYIFDREGRFAFVNQALLDLWGLKLADAVGKNFYDLKYPDELAERLQRQIQQVFESKTEVTDETPYTSPTGAGGYYEYIFRPVFDRSGNVEAVAGSTRDITGRKRVEQELRESQERFRALAESLEDQVKARTAELEERTHDVLRQAEQLRALSVSLMETQDREGRRIARELHDSVGQLLAALSMNQSQLLADPQITPSLALVVKQNASFVTQLSTEIRTISHLLHPPLLDEVGLRSALRVFIDGFADRSKLRVDLEIADDLPRFSLDVETALFRIVQECLTNIYRHSGSGSAIVNVSCERERIRLEVRDFGIGTNPRTLEQVRSGVGLRGMHERVLQLQGKLEIIPADPGTRVIAVLPFGPAGK